VGAEVFVVDQLAPSHCVFEPGAERIYDNALNLGWFDAIVERAGLPGQAALIGEHGESLRGPGLGELQELAASADALVNLCGSLRFNNIKSRVRRRIYVDLDPGLTHLWLATGRPAPRVVDHHLHFTVGENVGRPGCPLPTGGISWHHTRQPVLLDEWPAVPSPAPWRFTTVAGWRGPGPHGRLSDAGVATTDKADEFVRFAQVAPLSGHSFELAVAGVTDWSETAPLTDAGWVLADARERVGDPESFRHYVQGSGAEFSVAKGAYVDTRTGWFSDRTTRYLASGKPALVQDTGFERSIPVGDGLITFRTMQDAVTGVHRIATDYSHHAAAARQLAEEHFAAEIVLRRFIDESLSARI
jgi:hypothetical protein